MKLFRRPSPEDAFWTWFAQNADPIRTSLEAAHAREDFGRGVLGELSRRLAAVNPGLVWEAGRRPDGMEFVVSADGDREHFPAVQKLTARVPSIPGWRITSFRPRQDLADLELQFLPNPEATEPFTLSPRNVRFQMEPEPGGRVSLRLFVDGMRQGDDRVRGAMSSWTPRSGNTTWRRRSGSWRRSPRPPPRPARL